MRNSIIIILSIFFISCSSHQSKNIYSKIKPTNIHLKTTDITLINNFIKAKLLADSIIVTVFNSDSALSCFNIKYSFLYNNWEKSSTDSLVGKPEKYIFFYNLRTGNDTIYSSACIEIDTLNRILFFDFAHFVALKKIFNREMKINQSMAKKIGVNNGVSSNELIALLKYDVDRGSYIDNVDSIYNFNQFKTYWNDMRTNKHKFYWHIKNNCNGCVWVMIDADTGEIYDKGKVRYIY